MKKNIACTVILLFSIFYSLYGTDVLIYNFDVVITDKSDTSDDAAIQRLSSLFQKSFVAQSSSDITYKGLGSQTSNQITGTIKLIQGMVDALAVCFFYNTEYVMFGDVQIDKKTSKYTTHVNVYSKSQNDIVYELRYAKSVPRDEEAYTKEIADLVDGQLRSTIQSLPMLPTEKRIDELEKRLSETEKKKQDEEKAKKEDERLLTFMEKLLDTIQKDETESDTATKSTTKTSEIPVNKEKMFGYFMGLGYFFEFSGVWKNITIPLTTLQTGPKINILIVNTPSFDFYIRPALFIDYSVSMNTPSGSYNYYSRIHALGGSLAIDFFFEFGDLFGFSIGGGGQYNFDFISFREGVVKDFYPYQTYALGAFGNLSLELVLGNEKNLVIGINNIIHFVFYDTTYIDYRIMLFTMYKI